MPAALQAVFAHKDTHFYGIYLKIIIKILQREVILFFP